MPLTVVQISDSHLGQRTTVFRANIACVAAAVAAAPPDAIVASGDLSLDGADHAGDLAIAGETFRRMAGTTPLLPLPGNHDIGSERRSMPTQPVDATRLARWKAEFGSDRFVHDLDGPGGESWRLIGLDSEIMGAGLAVEEAAQAAFLEQALAELGQRRIAAFLHKPAFLAEPTDPFDYWTVPPEARGILRPLLNHPALRLVGSGHLHLGRIVRRGAVVFAWAPPTSFVCELEIQPGMPGDRVTGFLRHRLHADHVETEMVIPEGIQTPFLETVRAESYPRTT